MEDDNKVECVVNVNKRKRIKCDLIKQTVVSYLERRNYPIQGPVKLAIQDYQLRRVINCEVSYPNSILYSCFNSDPIIDQTLVKFVNWLKEEKKNNSKANELEVLVPLFFSCLYFEILHGGNTERASNFFKSHLYLVDKCKKNNFITDLVNAIGSNSLELIKLKEKFQFNKFSVNLSSSSLKLLRKFLRESGHIVLLQILQNHIDLHEVNSFENNKRHDIASFNKIYSKSAEKIRKCKSLRSATAGLKNDITPIFVSSLENVKNKISCGLLRRDFGMTFYCHSNIVTVRSNIPLKQLQKTKTLQDINLLGHTKKIYSLSFVDKFKGILSASEDKTIRLFDLNNFCQLNIYKGHDYPVYCVNSFKNGRYFVSGSHDSTARLWDFDRKDCLRVFTGHTQAITCTNTHSNCCYFVTGSADRHIRLWNLEECIPVRLFLGSKGKIYCLNFSNSGNYLISASDDKKLRVWDLVGCKILFEIDTYGDLVTKLSISDDDKILMTGTSEGVVKCWYFDELTKTRYSDISKRPFYQFSLNCTLLDFEYSLNSLGLLTAKFNKLL